MAKRQDYFERELVAEMSDRFAKNSRARRLLMRRSQQDIAFHMESIYGFPWHQTMVAKVESGERAVRLPEAFALCRVYGIELDDMLRGRNLDMIRNGRATVNLQHGTVHVAAASSGDRDAPLISIEAVLREGEEHLPEAKGEASGVDPEAR